MKLNHTNNFLARYWHPLDGSKIQCDLCPRFCQIPEGGTGFCFVRANENGKLVLTAYNHTTGLAVDPIEKKPLFHFLPGTDILSFGTIGCNLGCRFCQNWQITKHKVEMQSVTANAIIQAAKTNHCRSVAFTYNDPVIYPEFAIDVANACHDAGINTVAVTAGYINPQPRQDFFAVIDAANVDLKGFTEDFYQKYCLAKLAPVLDTLIFIKQKTKTWLEVTYLIIPDANDRTDEIQNMCRWFMQKLGPDVPLHFSAFHPDYHLTDRGRTPLTTLQQSRDIAIQAGLKYVYIGNIYDPKGETTFCSGCGKTLIGRQGFSLTSINLDKNGACLSCGTLCAGVF